MSSAMTAVVNTVRAIPKGMTRDCLWPWNYVEVRTNGDVALCCVRPPIGNLASGELAQLMRNNDARRLRSDLLSGTADRACAVCLLAPVTTTDALKQKVLALHPAKSA